MRLPLLALWLPVRSGSLMSSCLRRRSRSSVLVSAIRRWTMRTACLTRHLGIREGATPSCACPSGQGMAFGDGAVVHLAPSST